MASSADHPPVSTSYLPCSDTGDKAPDTGLLIICATSQRTSPLADAKDQLSSCDTFLDFYTVWTVRAPLYMGPEFNCDIFSSAIDTSRPLRGSHTLLLDSTVINIMCTVKMCTYSWIWDISLLTWIFL